MWSFTPDLKISKQSSLRAFYKEPLDQQGLPWLEGRLLISGRPKSKLASHVMVYLIHFNSWDNSRGLPMSLFAVAALGGTGLGPVVAGWVEMNPRLEWRWIQWIQMMYIFFLRPSLRILNVFAAPVRYILCSSQ